MTGDRFQWVVRDVERDLAEAVVRAARGSGRKTGELLNDLLRHWLHSGGAAKAESPLPVQLDLVDLVERLERLEGRVSELGTQTSPGPRRKAASASKASGASKVPAVHQAASQAAMARTNADRKGTISEEERKAWFRPPKYARLSEAGEAEIRRRLAAGQSGSEIGHVFGMTKAGVNKYRR